MSRNFTAFYTFFATAWCIAAVAGAWEITEIRTVDGQAVIEWNAAPGKSYRIERYSSLESATPTSAVAVTASSTLPQWTDTSSPSLPRLFYRISTSNDVRKIGLSDVRTWAYNIQHVDTPAQRAELVGSHFDMYVLEPAVTEEGNSGFDIAGLVSAIRAYNISNYCKDPLILAYVDIGESEDWRWYWQEGWTVGNPEWIVGEDPNFWEGNFPVAYWYAEWKDYVIYGSNGMSHVEETLKAGFDGIYMDWVEAFSDTNVTAKAQLDAVDPGAEMFNFIEEIRTYARQTSSNSNPNYLIVAQNAPDLYDEDPTRYTNLIDAIAQEGIWYDGDAGFDDWSEAGGFNVPTDDIYPGYTGELLEYYTNVFAGLMPIFCCEYAQDLDGTNYAALVYTNLAPAINAIPTCTRRSLARLSKIPYPHRYRPHDY
jgi:cysteinyl-tRNA synthetase